MRLVGRCNSIKKRIDQGFFSLQINKEGSKSRISVKEKKRRKEGEGFLFLNRMIG